MVLAASICTRGGKAILSRQFRDIHKDRVTALLASFPKLTQSETQHTTVETDNVRYVYQPLEELYVVLITNRQSNILQDIETLKVLSSVVSSITRNVDEREILLNSFELLSAFDEVVTLGYRENLSLQQIKTFLEMESHEEKIQEIIERNKEMEAAEERRKKAKQLEMQRREVSRRGQVGSPIGGGFGSGGAFGSSPSPFNPPVQQKPEPTIYDYEDTKPSKKSQPKGKGLQLGKKKTGNLDTLAESSPLMAPAPREPPTQTTAPAPAVVASSNNQGIEVSISETFSATLGRDGTVKESEIKGNLLLRIADPNLTKIKILTNANDSIAQFKTHPNVDKNGFNSSKIIGLKDPSRPFPSNNQQLAVLRWKVNTKQPQSPITFNCWFSKSDPGFFDVTVEYEVREDFSEPLKNVTILIPLVSSNCHVNDPDLVYEQYDDHLEWVIEEIQPGGDNASGSFEFSAEADQEDEFFPMQVKFEVTDAVSNYAQLEVLDVVSASDESNSLPFEKTVMMTADGFSIN